MLIALQWDTFSPSKGKNKYLMNLGIAADKVILKDLEYNPNKELTMRTLSKGVPQFNKMTERNEVNKIYNQFIGIINFLYFNYLNRHKSTRGKA